MDPNLNLKYTTISKMSDIKYDTFNIEMLGNSFNYTYIPTGIKHITIFSFNSINLNYLPNTIITLICRISSKSFVFYNIYNKLPANITYLFYRTTYCNTNNLPPFLKILEEESNSYKLNLNNLPHTIKMLNFGDHYDILPMSELNINNSKLNITHILLSINLKNFNPIINLNTLTHLALIYE